MGRNVFAKLFEAKEVFACEECEESFDDEDEFKEHYVEEHVEAEAKEVFACSKCDTKNDEEDDAKQHFVDEHQTVLFEHFETLVNEVAGLKREVRIAQEAGNAARAEADKLRAELAALIVRSRAVAPVAAPVEAAPVAPAAPVATVAPAKEATG